MAKGDFPQLRFLDPEALQTLNHALVYLKDELHQCILHENINV